MRGPLRIILPLVALVLSTHTALADKHWSFSGSSRTFGYAVDPNVFVGGGDGSLLWSLASRLRLEAQYDPADPIRVEAAYDFIPRLASTELLATPETGFRIEGPVYRVNDLDFRLWPGNDADVNDFIISQNLDRLYVLSSMDHFDIYIGRQAVAWGAARAINPTDILTIFRFDALDAEDRIGVDALRVRTPVGALGEVDAGYVAGEHFDIDRSAYYLRTKLSVAGSDASVLAMRFFDNTLLGFDVTRAIGGAGTWLETAYVLAGEERAVTSSGGQVDTLRAEDYWRLTMGGDYSFGGVHYVFAEYHYNGAGTTKPEDYVDNASQIAFAEGTVYLLGKHYIIPGITSQLTPLLSATATALTNLTDPSLLLSLSLEYNMTENMYVAGGAYVGFGNDVVSTDPPVLGSEFGAYSDTYFVAFRVYF